MIAFGYGASRAARGRSGAGWLHGLKIVAVAVVAQAVIGMARALCPDRARAAHRGRRRVVMLLRRRRRSARSPPSCWAAFSAGRCLRRESVTGDALSVPVSRVVFASRR